MQIDKECTLENIREFEEALGEHCSPFESCPDGCPYNKICTFLIDLRDYITEEC